MMTSTSTPPSSSRTPRNSMDPMDLIRYEVLRNLDNWLNRLFSHHEYNRLSWIEFGWSAFQLNTRYPQWSFLREGLYILEAAKNKDESQVTLMGRRMLANIEEELTKIDKRKAPPSVA